MPFSSEIEAFIREFVEDLHGNTAAIFAGAGLSKAAGYVDWPELLREIAEELGLSVDREHDLISLAQFHVNEKQNSEKLAQKIMTEFQEHSELSPLHEILARLPITTYWTTNYDELIENALRGALKVADVKHNVKSLRFARHKRDAVVYKMHGDVRDAGDAVIYKEQYERYHQTHSQFITALTGDLVSKRFLFVGFSFSDPNLDYVLSRLHSDTKKSHYCFMRNVQAAPGEDDELFRYRKRKQSLRMQDLKRYGIQTLLVDEYDEIQLVIREIEARYLKRTVFIAGSADEFHPWGREEAQNFIHSLSAQLVRNNYRVVSGFGWGVGTSVINGALEAIYSNPGRFSEEQLVVRPFPQFATKGTDLGELWEQYRRRMISLAGVTLFIFGNKSGPDGSILAADGVMREFEITVEMGRIPLPIGATGFVAETIWTAVSGEPSRFYPNCPWIVPELAKISEPGVNTDEIVDTVIRIVSRLSK